MEELTDAKIIERFEKLENRVEKINALLFSIHNRLDRLDRLDRMGFTEPEQSYEMMEDISEEKKPKRKKK